MLPMENDHLVTVKVLNFSHEVGIVRSFLESRGIRCVVQDELTNQVYPLAANAIGGIKLQVMADDAEEAVKILKEGGFLTEEDLQPSKFQLRLYKFLSKIPFIRKQLE